MRPAFTQYQKLVSVRHVFISGEQNNEPKTRTLFDNMTEELAEQLEGTALCSPEILTQCEVCGKVGPTGDIITIWMGDDPTPNNPTGDTTICHECLHKLTITVLR